MGSDNEQGGYLAGKHLMERGRRNIAFLGTVSDDAPEFLERWTGYQRALREAGVDQSPQLRIDAGPSEDAGRNAALKLLSQGVAFDGIFATSDLAAIGAMRALREAGIDVPKEVSIVGYDDLAAARMAEPAITTIAQDTKLAGETLVETLIAKIEEHAPESVLLPVRLVVRGSS